MNESYALYAQEQNEDVKTDRIREDFALSLTNKQYLNLKLMVYQAGFKNTGDFIQSFIGDLTGWSSSGSDERDLADQWYQRAHGMSDFTFYFHYFLFNHDCDLETMLNLLENEDYLDDIYEEYKEDADGKDVQSKEECVQILNEIIKQGNEL